MKLVSQTVLPSLLPGQVINDMANPIQAVTLRVNNDWKWYDLSGYEIKLDRAPAMGFVRVAFSETDEGLTLYQGRKVRIPSGFRGCRLYVGNGAGNYDDIRLVITREKSIELPHDESPIWLPEIRASVNSGLNLLGTVLLDSGPVVGGLYELQYNVASNVSSVNAYGIKHYESDGATPVLAPNFWYMNTAIDQGEGIWHKIANYPMRPNERIKFICEDDSGSANTTNVILLMSRKV